MQKKGNKFGTHRVISPKGVLPQPADKIDNNMDEIYDNEILIDVMTLNIVVNFVCRLWQNSLRRYYSVCTEFITFLLHCFIFFIVFFTIFSIREFREPQPE